VSDVVPDRAGASRERERDGRVARAQGIATAGGRLLVDVQDFPLEEGAITFLFGESGIGKSLIGKAIFGLLDESDRIFAAWPRQARETPDAEIEALEGRLAKTRDLKTAMAQELLSGRTRLV